MFNMPKNHCYVYLRDTVHWANNMHIMPEYRTGENVPCLAFTIDKLMAGSLER